MKEFKIKPQNICNMDEKRFLISIIEESRRVLIAAGERAASSGSLETVRVKLKLLVFSTRTYHRLLFSRAKTIFTDGTEERCQHIELQQYHQTAGLMPY